MTRNVMLSTDRRWLVAWGRHERDGLFVQIYANTPGTEEYGPLMYWCERTHPGLTPTRLIEITDEYGVGDIVRATLFGAY
jgi:hypothetical protein